MKTKVYNFAKIKAWKKFSSWYHSPQFKSMMFHTFTCSLDILQVYHELTKWPALSWLDNSAGRALHRYSRAYGFESLSSPHFFSGLISQLLNLCTTAMICHVFIQPSHSNISSVIMVTLDKNERSPPSQSRNVWPRLFKGWITLSKG